MTEPEYLAGEGQIWICRACGKSGKDRTRINDESCFLNAVLCLEASIKRNEKGRITHADAVPKAEGA